MSKKIAFTLATAITVFVLVTVTALVATLTASAGVFKASQGGDITAAEVPQEAFIAASARPEAALPNNSASKPVSGDASAMLDKMQSQVQTLLEREKIYQQRLNEANNEWAKSADGPAVEQQAQIYTHQLNEAATQLQQANDTVQQLQQENLALAAGEQQYSQELTKASDLLKQAYDQLAASQSQISQLKDQNTALLQQQQASPTPSAGVTTSSSSTASTATTTQTTVSTKSLEQQMEQQKKALKRQREAAKKALEAEHEDHEEEKDH
ncbi:MAG: hypothetical protein FJ316_07300 [SAR202 cluster bacterium]|nr:hypothetical protein [SAR202 cluster bacterium]